MVLHIQAGRTWFSGSKRGTESSLLKCKCSEPCQSAQGLKQGAAEPGNPVTSHASDDADGAGGTVRFLSPDFLGGPLIWGV